MKSIQVIDGSQNSVYDIFAASEEEFNLIFPAGTDIAFIEEVYANGDVKSLDVAFNNIWERRIKKCDVQGIHGIIFYELAEKMRFYPGRKDEEAINPDGSRLR